jgi:hypothetical protein
VIREASAFVVGFNILLSALAARADTRTDADEDPRDRRHVEPAVLPSFGGSTDTGVELGGLLQLARFEPGARPYAWRVVGQLAASVRDGPEGVELPFHDDYVRVDVPRFPAKGGRFLASVAYQRYTSLGYYGLGNVAAVSVPTPDPSGGRYTSYLSSTLLLDASVWQSLGDSRVSAVFGASIAWQDVEAYPGSLLATDVARSGGPNGVASYPLTGVRAGVLLDTRNHETAPTRGVFHDLVVAVAAPGINTFSFADVTLTTRFYVPVLGERLVLSMRALADVLTGDVPIVQQAAYGGVFGGAGPGGANGVRGVPFGRFVGDTKVIGNLELRSLLVPVDLADQHLVLGAAAFVDAGRVWSKPLGADPARDGGNPGLHVGMGGGPRVRWGDSFLLRLDLAYAPGADAAGRNGTVGFYITGDAPF